MKNVWSLYKKYIIAFLLISIIIFILTYIWFQIKGFLPVGPDLEKRDWLLFTSGFLSFLGTMLLGALALYQNIKLDEANIRSHDISNRLLLLEEEEQIPLIDISLGKEILISNDIFGEGMVSAENLIFIYCEKEKEEGVSICFDIKNVSKVFIKQLNITRIRLTDLDVISDEILINNESKIENEFTIIGVNETNRIELFVQGKINENTMKNSMNFLLMIEFEIHTFAGRVFSEKLYIWSRKSDNIHKIVSRIIDISHMRNL
jgi:hypothetical protein